MALPALKFNMKTMMNYFNDEAYDTLMGNFWLINLTCLSFTGY